MGVGINGLIEDVIAVLPLEGWQSPLITKWKPANCSRPWLELFTSLYWWSISTGSICISGAAYFMFLLLCEFLWSMHYSYPQNMVNTVQGWSEYPEMLQILREMVDDVERMSKLLWEKFWQGKVFNIWSCNVNSTCLLLTCLKYYDAE